MTSLDRRDFIRLNAAALAGAVLLPGASSATQPRSTGASAAAPRDSAPGFYRFALGEVEITVFSDGSFGLPGAVPTIDVSPHEFLALNVDAPTREEYFRSRMVPADDLPLPANPVLLDFGGRRALVDSGGWLGSPSPPTLGRLDAAMDAAGVSPESIDVVVLTHGHPDHLGGLLRPDDQTPHFPEAEVVISDVELDLWTGPHAEERLRELPLPIPAIQQVFSSVEDRLRTVRAGDEIVPGMRSMPSPGHTQGHLALAVESRGETLLLPGDAIANIHVHFERPDWLTLFDHEPERASRTRARLLDLAADEEMLILGYHFPFPGLGHALRDGDAYRWYPAGWKVLP